jgi:hypothetical protein
MHSNLTLRILQYNVRRSKDIVMAPLLRDPAILRYDIIAIQEPWINPYEYNSHNPISSLFTLWLPKQGDKPPGVAFYINKRLDHSLVSFTSHTSHLATIAVTYSTGNINTNTIHIHNVYNQPPDEKPTSTLRELEAIVKRIRTSPKSKNHEQLLVGDFNMEGPEWAADDLGDRGSARQGLPYFRELLATENLEIVLPKGTITREERGALSTIDLAICDRRSLFKLVECRRVDELDHDSDHWPIHTILDLQPEQAPERPPIKLWNRTPITEFCQSLQSKLPKLKSRLTNEEVSQLMLQVVEALATTIEDIVPTTKPTTWHTPGFTAECKAKCNEVRKFRKAWQQTRAEKDWETYRVARNEKGKLITKALQEAHRERVNRAADEGPKGLWKLAKWARSKGLGAAQQRVTPTIEGQDTHEGKVAALSRVFFPVPPAIRGQGVAPGEELTLTFSDEFPCPPLTKDEVQKAILRPRPHKAPGLSGIPNYILRISMHLLLPILQPLFNYCFFRGICPFQDSVTVVLKKPNKDDYSKAKAYRPIALLETLGKAFESAIAERISYYVEEHQLLPEDHIGARKTRSTEHAIHTLLERIYKAHEQADKGTHKVATLLMLDASGAFDNVHHNKLVDCLARRKIPAPIVLWIREWLKGRRTKLKLPEGESSWVDLKYGVPQGSSLSPILWLFYNADLLDEIIQGAQGAQRAQGTQGTSGATEVRETQGTTGSPVVTTTAWVDDTGILIIGDTAAENCRALEKIHDRAADWATRYGCVFAPDKYEVMHFHTKRTDNKKRNITPPPPDECLRLPGTPPKEPTNKLRHLGVWLDPALTWDHHIAATATKVRK